MRGTDITPWPYYNTFKEAEEMDMQISMSEDVSEIAKALCEVQQCELFALTDKKNPFYKSEYADISSVWSAIRKPLTDNDLAIAQPLGRLGDLITISTILLHKSGQWIKGSLSVKPKPDKDGHEDPQKVGALITYLRRFSISAMVGVCPADDDGNIASGKSETKKPSPAIIPSKDAVYGGGDSPLNSDQRGLPEPTEKSLGEMRTALVEMQKNADDKLIDAMHKLKIDNIPANAEALRNLYVMTA